MLPVPIFPNSKNTRPVSDWFLPWPGNFYAKQPEGSKAINEFGILSHSRRLPAVLIAQIFLIKKTFFMGNRLIMGKVQPEAYRAMNGLDKYIQSSPLPALQKEMIKIRASQINGCAYCVHSHTTEARKQGETEQRIYLMSVWKEAGDIFSEEEKLLLAITEAITLIHQKGLKDELYERAVRMFGEELTAQIIMMVITINAWNRVGVSLQMHPVIEV
jgi:AhpD family alkylhydroperoxidase